MTITHYTLSLLAGEQSILCCRTVLREIWKKFERKTIEKVKEITPTFSVQ
jgi:hypothetical protein